MNILFIGDVVGKPGRQAIRRWLPELAQRYALDFVVANGENSAGGLGATNETLEEILNAGVHAITLGNHTWRKKTFAAGIDRFTNVVRPANYAPGVPGRGAVIVGAPNGVRVGLVNLQGRVFMEPVACPFILGLEVVEQLRAETPVIVVDMHAEATAEKIALGWHLDGRCSAVVGTHTHVQTADERILPLGTAYITDVGMTGPADSVIGMEKERVVRRFLNGMPVEFRVASGPVSLQGVVIGVDPQSGRAASIQRVMVSDDR